MNYLCAVLCCDSRTIQLARGQQAYSDTKVSANSRTYGSPGPLQTISDHNGSASGSREDKIPWAHIIYLQSPGRCVRAGKHYSVLSCRLMMLSVYNANVPLGKHWKILLLCSRGTLYQRTLKIPHFQQPDKYWWYIRLAYTANHSPFISDFHPFTLSRF